MEVNKIDLGNGLGIIYDFNPGVKTVTIVVVVRVGSRDEEKEEHGLAHFVEHLLFKKNSVRKIDDIYKEIDKLGGDLDAFTTRESTYFTLKILKAYFSQGIKLLSDIILRPEFSEDEIELEKMVVKEEIRMYKDSPEDIVFDNFLRASWDKHPLVREILGTEESISNFSKDLILNFYNKHYIPQKTIIGVSGDISLERIEDVFEDYFVFGNKNNIEINSNEKIPKFKPKVFTQKRSFEQIHLVWGTEGYKIKDSRRVPLSLLSMSLGGGLSSRLFKELREKRGLVYNVETHFLSFRDVTLFGIYTATTPKYFKETFHALLEEREKLLKDGINKEELDLAKKQSINGFLMGLESPTQRLFYLLDSFLIYGKTIPWTEKIKNIRKIQLNEIDETIKDIFLKPFSMSLVGPINSDLKEFLERGERYD